MKRSFYGLIICLFFSVLRVTAQTPVPNGGFESWVTSGSYENPQYWDTPNQAISLAIQIGRAHV